MGTMLGKTTAGAIRAVLVDDDGGLVVAAITPGSITIEDVTIEKMIGGLPEHWNGTATTSPATVTFSATSRSVMIDNLGDTNNLLFSLDGGTKYKTLPPESSISIMCDRATVLVKSNASTTAYEIVAVVAE